MPEFDLADLVANGTLSPQMAETLAAAAVERRSFVVAAIPQRAGKSTMTEAVLAAAPAGTLLHRLSLNHGPTLGIPQQPDGGYLVVAEIAQTPFADYLWGEPVRRVFDAVRVGWPVAATLHSDGIEGAFDQIVRGCGVSDADAVAIELFVYIRTFGRRFEPSRRVVERIYEVDAVEGGRPVARLLHFWDQATDRFEVVDSPRRIGRGVVRPGARSG
jgi:type IV secretory pathway ATPase VirB11/archaellum biosynthesis ATPase